MLGCEGVNTLFLSHPSASGKGPLGALKAPSRGLPTGVSSLKPHFPGWQGQGWVEPCVPGWPGGAWSGPSHSAAADTAALGLHRPCPWECL